MIRFPAPLRFFFVFTAIVLPLAAFAVLESGPRAGYAIVVAMLLGALAVALGLERRLARSFPGASGVPDGLRRSLERAAPEFAGRIRLFIYADSVPNAAVFRSLGGPGTVALSRGLVSLLTEEELRAVLATCAARTSEKGVVIRSFFAQLSVWLCNLIPDAWIQSVQGTERTAAKRHPLSPWGALAFLIVYPWVGFFSRAGGSGKLERGGPEYHGAMRKISELTTRWGYSGNPGAANLYLVLPWSGQMLLPFARGWR